jgi:nucleoside-diphosphate-sugar epimerase
MAQAPTVAITGATGYLGGVLRDTFDDAGWDTISLARSATVGTTRHYVVGEPPSDDLLDGVDVLIHCAYDMSVTSREEIWRTNVDGTRRLLDRADDTGVSRVVVLSSMSAYAGTTQLYGLSKLDIERQARECGAVSVRPGLVYGPRAGGMAGALSSLTRLPVVPVVASRSHQFTVHEDDFAAAIMALVSAPEVTTDPIGVANPVPVPFRQVIEGLARQNHRTCRTVPVDWRLVHAALRAGEAMNVALPFRSDSLFGLARPASSVPNLGVLAELGVRLRRFGQPVLPSPRPE